MSALPTGWRDRLIKVQNANTAAPGGGPQYIGWCLDKEELCVTKLCAFREKDRNFVAAVMHSSRVDRDTILARLTAVDERYRSAAERASSCLRSLEAPKDKRHFQAQRSVSFRLATGGEPTA